MAERGRHFLGTSLFEVDEVVSVAYDPASFLAEYSKCDEDVEGVIDPAFDILFVFALDETKKYLVVEFLLIVQFID